MLSKQTIITALVVCFFMSACGTRLVQIPTPLPSYTPPPSSPTPAIAETIAPTSTPGIVETATPTPTATPLPVCNPGRLLENGSNGSLPSYIDILNASTKISGRNLTVTFAMNWLPEQITIDRNILAFDSAEIAWGVAIDVDNDPATGAAIPLTSSGYGYEYLLQAINFKQGDEQQGDLQTLFNDKVHVWEVYPEGNSAILTSGKIEVDTATASITLSGAINGIQKDSYLHFFAVYFPTATQQMTEELCRR